jgi:hypothetical protein
MGLDVQAAVREAATQTGLVLMMHANSFEAQKFAVDGHVDVIAHGMWNWGDLDKQTDLPPKIGKVLDQIAEEKIGYQPTLQVMQGLRAYFEPEYLKMKVNGSKKKPRRTMRRTRPCVKDSTLAQSAECTKWLPT